MRPEIEKRVQKIKKVSRIFRVICKILLAFITLAGIGTVVNVVLGTGGINFGINSPIFQTAGLTLGWRLLLGAVTAASWLVLFKGFYHLQHLFGTYSRGDIFTRESAHDLRWFGIAYNLGGF